MTKDQNPHEELEEVERHDYAALVDSLADTLNLHDGLSEAVEVVSYHTMSNHIASFLDLENGLQSALTASIHTDTMPSVGRTSQAKRLLDSPGVATFTQHAGRGYAALSHANTALAAHSFDAALNPPYLRIALGGYLRRLREASGITREAAGYEIRGSTGKISRLELGRIAFKEHDVADLLTLYGVTDAEKRETFLNLVRQANAPGWWREYSDVLTSGFETYLGLEQTASVIRVYETQFVTGLLQTEDYARVILRCPHASADEIERRVALRMARQAFLTQPGAPDLWVVLDEAVLRRSLGDRNVGHVQMKHLIEMAQLPNITLQIVPFHAGARAAAGRAFTILRFSELDLPDIVYLEYLTNAQCLDKKRDTVDYLSIMDSLCIQAESPTDTVSFLRRIINE